MGAAVYCSYVGKIHIVLQSFPYSTDVQVNLKQSPTVVIINSLFPNINDTNESYETDAVASHNYVNLTCISAKEQYIQQLPTLEPKRGRV